VLKNNPRLESGRFLTIDRIYAFVTKDKDGHEGIMAYMTDQGWMPMVGADMDRVESLKPQADKIAKISGMEYEIREFNNFDFTKLAEIIGRWYVEWKDKLTDKPVPNNFGFAKEDLKRRIQEER
jgi:hypothetical protein